VANKTQTETALKRLHAQGQTNKNFYFEVTALATGVKNFVPGNVIGGFLNGSQYQIRPIWDLDDAPKELESSLDVILGEVMDTPEVFEEVPQGFDLDEFNQLNWMVARKEVMGMSDVDALKLIIAGGKYDKVKQSAQTRLDELEG
jgi:hypothetical protein